ncbi:MAG: glycosyltransferase family 4 protein [Synechococcaceae cyanobacterium]|nr:glycosyltransferase family 4 protein [Synechococcaceae cyanobacterium]
MLSPTFHPHHGGAESLADDLARLLVEQGHGVTVLTATEGQSTAPEWRHGARVLRLSDQPLDLSSLISPRQLVRHSRIVRRHRHLLDEGRFDAVCIARINESARHVLRERGRLGFRLTAYLHGGELRSLQKGSRRFRRILRWTLREADSIVAVSAELRQEAIRFAPGAAGKIVLLPNGVDVARIRRAPAPQAAPRPYALFAGRLERVKNPGFLIESFARIAATTPELDLLIVGTGSQAALLADRVSALGLVDRVRLLGDQPREQVFSLMKGACCLVVPSLAEAHPLVVLEAWAAGLPVLASAVKGLRNLVTEDRGALFCLENPDGLAELLQQVAKDPPFLAERRRNLAGLEPGPLDIGTLVERHVALLTGSEG